MRSLRSPLPIRLLRIDASFCCRSLQLAVEQARGEHRHRLRAVAMLRAVVLAFDDEAGRQVRDAHRRIGLVDVLAAGARRAERVDAQVGGIDRRCRRSGSASGITATVHAEVWMRPCASVSGTRCTRWPPDSNLSFEYAPSPTMRSDHFLVAAELRRRLGHDLDLPALRARRSACTSGTGSPANSADLVAAGAGADFEEHVALVVGVLRQQHPLQVRRRAPPSARVAAARSSSANAFIAGSRAISSAAATSASAVPYSR